LNRSSSNVSAGTQEINKDYQPPFGGRKIWVGGTKELDSDDLEQHFMRFGRVATAGVMRKKDGDKRGFGFVTFFDRRDSAKAVRRSETKYKRGSEFARMTMKACEAPASAELDLDLRTAEILQKEDARRKAMYIATKVESMDMERLLAMEKAADRTQAVAIDCEMVGVGQEGRSSCLARVCVINEKQEILYMRNVVPSEPVTDYRTHITGLREGVLTEEKGAISFEKAQEEVKGILRGRTLVGHALRNDLNVLMLEHPFRAIRDTSRYRPLREAGQHGTPSLKSLAERLLDNKIQEGVHSPYEDAKVAMQIYLMHK